jgi:hypothetical protein
MRFFLYVVASAMVMPAARAQTAPDFGRVRLKLGDTISALLLLCLLLSPAPVHAQVDFSTLPIRTGDIVYVKEASGTEVSGPVVKLSPSSLSIAGQDFTPANTLQIDRRGDSLKNGAWIGAAVLSGWCVAVCGQGVNNGTELAQAVAGAAGWGALFGALIDWRHKGRTTIFRASPSVRLLPSVGPNRRAFSATVSF